MKTLISNVQNGPFDWVVIDTPPVLAVTDAVIIAPGSPASCSSSARR